MKSSLVAHSRKINLITGGTNQGVIFEKKKKKRTKKQREQGKEKRTRENSSISQLLKGYAVKLRREIYSWNVTVSLTNSKLRRNEFLRGERAPGWTGAS